ncbi:hypothetical protein GOP47_0000380 [Adiantum capillus-veneris]|uniref:Protein PALE CRESS, chloroplastic n=1 Tax=Adiantum capillus-veneris TaxID=13818 RepID=A0A9D4VCW9_ADICA|nr:hypothetical protein GOP47_0000380 [Adiantum capillus-veneris]
MECVASLSSPPSSWSLQAASPHNGASLLQTYRTCRSLMKSFACLAQPDKEAAFARLVQMNPKINDEEWQRERRRESEELRKRREQEEKEEAQKTENYREISKRMESYDEAEVKRAKALVASFIKAGEEVEEKIQEAAENGMLTKMVLIVIYNRLELARHDNERHIVQALDLLYRRIEAEILRREATPAMQYLDELLNLQDGTSHEDWIRRCRQSMITTFPREDAFSFLVPSDFDLLKHHGPIDIPLEEDVLLRSDFIREVDDFLAEIAASQPKGELVGDLDPRTVAIHLSQQQKGRAIQQVRDLLNLAVELEW